ncbi:MAG: hypothetical protein IPI45_00040 [Saprospiraceae bacterium]|nr:hypothetical protein [Saprospiraceae bacterium]
MNIYFKLKLKCNNFAGVRKQNCSSFASFGIERWLVGLANVLRCGWGFFLLFLRGEKNKINFHQICTVLSKAKTLFFFLIYTIRFVFLPPLFFFFSPRGGGDSPPPRGRVEEEKKFKKKKKKKKKKIKKGRRGGGVFCFGGGGGVKLVFISVRFFFLGEEKFGFF